MRTRDGHQGSLPLVVDAKKHPEGPASSDHRVIVEGPASTRTARAGESLGFVTGYF